VDRGYSSIARGLALSAQRFPDKPALVELGRLTLSYAMLDRGVNRLANALLARGVGPGDHVAVLSENSVEHIVALYAITRAGAVSVALDPRWTAAETERALILFDCRLVIADSSLVDKLTATAPALGRILYERSSARCDLLESLAQHSDEDPAVVLRDEDVCTLVLTSGTTGRPKGVMRTHRNVEMGCLNGVLGKAQDDSSRELAVVPLYYGSGRGSVLAQIYVGSTVFVMPSFDPERAAWLIGQEKITAIALAPTMCHRLLQLPRLERFDFSSLGSLRKAGSPFTRQMAVEIIAKLTPNIYQGYASTESGSVSLLRPPEQLAKVGSAGRTVWGAEVKLLDATGQCRAARKARSACAAPMSARAITATPRNMRRHSMTAGITPATSDISTTKAISTCPAASRT
jgi:acyl-CoA synthetase (AMP-forming)/AMP-acid ligase II